MLSLEINKRNEQESYAYNYEIIIIYESSGVPGKKKYGESYHNSKYFNKTVEQEITIDTY